MEQTKIKVDKEVYSSYNYSYFENNREYIMKTINLACQHGNFTFEIESNKSITVQRDEYLTKTRFVVGDWAEYDSYNLAYTGIIRSITEKTVTIEAYPDTKSAQKHRLKLGTFAWRNYNFSKVDTDKRNSDISNYI